MNTAPDSATGESMAVTLVDAKDCHYCKLAHDILDDLKARYPIEVEAVDMESARGRDLVARSRVPFPPLLLIEGRYFGHGRISRKKLERHLVASLGI